MGGVTESICAEKMIKKQKSRCLNPRRSTVGNGSLEPNNMRIPETTKVWSLAATAVDEWLTNWGGYTPY